MRQFPYIQWDLSPRGANFRSLAGGIARSVRTPSPAQRQEALRTATIILAGALILGLAPSAQAQSETPSSHDQEARSLYNAGRIAFNEGRFQNALDYFQRAYELSGRPGLLHNIGTTADRLRMDDLALQSFQQYLAEVPDAQNRSSVEARIVVLEQAVDANQHAVEPEPEVQPVYVPTPEEAAAAAAAAEQVDVVPVDEGFSPSPALTWSLIGGGAGLATVGVVMLGIGQRNRGYIEDAPPGEDWADYEEYENADALTAGGITMLILGASTAAVGVVFKFMDNDDEMAEVERETELVVGPGSFMVRGTL